MRPAEPSRDFEIRGLTSPQRTGLDVTVPNVARVYDVLLGGRNNLAADRQVAEKLLAAVPGAAVAARENRAFLARAVRFLCQEAGIRQFIDIGAGLPAGGSVHEITEGAVPPPRVVYADNDLMVLRHADALIGGRLNVEAVHADLRQPRWLLTQPAVQRVIDLSQPVAILLVAVLHFLSGQEDPHAVVNYLKDQVAPGSYLVVSHVTAEHIVHQLECIEIDKENGEQILYRVALSDSAIQPIEQRSAIRKICQ